MTPDERARLLALVELVEEFVGWWHLHRDGSVNAAYARIDTFTKQLAALLPPVGDVDRPYVDSAATPFEAFGHNESCGRWVEGPSAISLDRRRPCTCGGIELHPDGPIGYGSDCFSDLASKASPEGEPPTIGQCTARHSSGRRCVLPWPHYGKVHWSVGFSWPNSERPAVARAVAVEERKDNG